MITSFGDAATEDLYHNRPSNRARRFPANIRKAALRKLDVLNAAHRPDDLLSPPGNHLEMLRGDRQGFYSIRVNEQWRIIFRWSENSASDVSLVDYHS